MRLSYIKFNAQSPEDRQTERTNGIDSGQNGRGLWNCRSSHCIALGVRKDRSQGAGHALSHVSRYAIRFRTQARLEKTQPHRQTRRLQVALNQLSFKIGDVCPRWIGPNSKLSRNGRKSTQATPMRSMTKVRNLGFLFPFFSPPANVSSLKKLGKPTKKTTASDERQG